ncbi:MAG: PAS domain S-box protein [Streptosporangiaceae bacterium]|jgi:two-component system cell cycle sensor histidine kinase/response regulator CckA
MPFADRVGLLEAVSDAVVCVDVGGRIVLVNAQAERLFGYGREELAGVPADMLVLGADQAGHSVPWAAPLAHPRSGPVVEGLDRVGRRRDGSTFPAEISLSAIAPSASDGGEGLLIMAVIRDVTERREADATAARLAAVLQLSPDAVIGESADRVITSWNPAAERIYGYTAAEMIGRPADALIRPESRGEEREIQAAITRGERIGEYRSDRVRKDGTAIRVSVTLSPIAERTGTIVGVSTVSRDITGQQRAGTRFRGLIEAAPDAVVCVDVSGRIVLVNAQTERLFGYGREELTGQPVEILVPDAARASHPAHRAAYVADPQSRPMGADLELTGRRRDGSTFPVEISLSAITPSVNDGGENILVSAAVRDVTERLELQAVRERLKTQAERDRMERQLQQSQRLESLGQLAGGVAHDFNNLLAVISNYAAFVREEVASKAPQNEWQSVREDIGQIERAAERAAGLTHQLLAFARRDVVHPRALNLNQVIEGVQQLLVRTLGEHVELSTDLAAGLSPVLADPGQIEQILVNLAVNARDAMPAGGKLIIATAGTSLDANDAASQVGLTPGRYISLKVSDTGTGMPQAVIDRAFEPFFTTKAKGEGTGLGLATVYGIITQAGGHVQIYSEPGLGTTFTILLPETSRPFHGSSLVPSQVARGGTGETVLVVEDEAAVRELTRRILAGHGYKVITAVNGLDAIEIAARRPRDIDVLLTDVVMPQMLGREAAERIRALCPAVQVLFMSGYSHGVLDTQGVLEPGVNLIEKPFTEASLLAKLRETLSLRGSSSRF